ARRRPRALRDRAHLSAGAGYGRREALRVPRRRARRERHRRDVRRVLRCLPARGRPVRASRQGGAEGIDPARAVPRPGRRDRSLLGGRDPRLVSPARRRVERRESLQPGRRKADVRPMEHGSAATRVIRPIDPALLAAGARTAAGAIQEADEPARAVELAVDALYDAVAGVMPSVFVLEHGRLWLVAQRGYAVVPDGITVESGITGRAIRLGRAQLAPDVATDPDYVAALPGIVSELAVPLRSGRLTVGVLNVEAERALPDGAADALRPLARALAPLVEAVRASRTLDLAALARLFVHLGSLRDPHDLAALGAASLPKVLPVETSQLVVWDELGATRELAVWQAD